MFIYLVTNLKNGKYYIGKTSQGSIQLRWSQHCYEAFRYYWKDYSLLHIAMREFGVEAFSITTIFETDDPTELASMEEKFILQYKSNLPEFGYNNKVGTKFSPSLKAKLSESRIGIVFPPEQRQAMSRARKGRAPWNKGKFGYKMPPASSERKENIRKALKVKSSFLTAKRGYGGMVYGAGKEPSVEEETRRKIVRGAIVENVVGSQVAYKWQDGSEHVGVLQSKGRKWARVVNDKTKVLDWVLIENIQKHEEKAA